MTNPIYLATVLLEPNRWSSREPSIDLREWLPRIRKAGFEGLEIWDDHLLKTDDAVSLAIAEADIPIILNQYDCGLDESAAKRQQLHQLMTQIGCQGMKWNGPKGSEGAEESLHNMREWISQFPAPFQAMCECHPGTVFEDIPAFAAQTANWQQPPPLIIHPLNIELATLHHLLTEHKNRIVHMHMQMREDIGNDIIRLDERPKLLSERIALLKDAGYTGSYSIEFTRGCVHQGGPEIETLFDNAVHDLNTLRSILETNA